MMLRSFRLQNSSIRSGRWPLSANWRGTATGLLALLAFGACRKETPASSRPRIYELAVSTRQLSLAPGSRDTLHLVFQFSDGDADISNATVTLKDQLDGAAQEYAYPLPRIETQDMNLPDGANGRIGVSLSVGEPILQLVDSTRPQKLFRLFMTDNAGQQSNALTTDTIRFSF